MCKTEEKTLSLQQQQQHLWVVSQGACESLYHTQADSAHADEVFKVKRRDVQRKEEDRAK